MVVEESVCCVWKIAILCVIVSGDKNVICNKKSWKDSFKFVFIMTRLPAILNVINNKCCGTFQARSWIIFHFQGKDSTHAWLAKLSTHRRRNIYVFPILYRLLIDQTILNERYGCLWLKCILSDIQQRIYFIMDAFKISQTSLTVCKQ
jgi:hypothetical protein